MLRREMEVKALGETFLQCNFERKQKINIWSSWAGAVRKEVAEMWERKKTEPKQSEVL